MYTCTVLALYNLKRVPDLVNLVHTLKIITKFCKLNVDWLQSILLCGNFLPYFESYGALKLSTE